uniref:SH2 domain-containing protein n=1 Tax=Panagrolaimus sp. JU765 TaxID=591449 RepID=A0AC34R2C3_9BILA
MSGGEEDVAASTSLCECIREVESQGWYWGAISSKESKRLLEKQPSGTFLVRDSQSDDCIFTIVYKTTNGIGQTRVQRFRGKFCLGGPNSLIREQS